MVRVNLISPEALADQHLIAEYNEILMLIGYVKKYPKQVGVPKEYTLGLGHIKFFKDKLVYLQKRHELLKKEMRKRGFVTQVNIDLKGFDKMLLNDWKPSGKDIKLIKERIIWKIEEKPDYYRYYGEHKPKEFLIGLIMKA